MSAYVLLNLLDELGEKDKMRCLQSILSILRSKFNKSNVTNIRIYLSYDTKNTSKSYFWCKKL